jgi:hypothetical protein
MDTFLLVGNLLSETKEFAWVARLTLVTVIGTEKRTVKVF